MPRVLTLALVALVALAVSRSARPAAELEGAGLKLVLPAGWHGRAAPGELQAADFPLPRAVVAAPSRARVPRGRVHLVVWDYGPAVPYLAAGFPVARPPLRLRRGDVTGAPIEGFSGRDAYAVRSVTLAGELLEIVADLGPRPFRPGGLRALNGVLATLRVRAPRVVDPVHGLLAHDGVRVRLPAGWAGRMEVPADPHAAQLVLRARRGAVRVVLLELAGAQGRHRDLPVRIAARDVLRGHRPRLARLVFSTAGRGFDLSVTVPSGAALEAANRLLAALSVAPRPWVFRSCGVMLRLPGSWRAGVNPRSGCYPVITLRRPGVRVLVAELRRGERGAPPLLRRSGRRFTIHVAPRSARRAAARVLATLRAAHRR